MSKDFPPTTSLDDLLVNIKSAESNKNVGKVTQIVLKEGPRAFRTATIFQILDDSGAHHHYTLTIHCFDRTKEGWSFDRKRYVTIEKTELTALNTFLQAALDSPLPDDGSYRLVDDATYSGLADFAKYAKEADSDEKLDLIRALLDGLSLADIDEENLRTVLEHGDDGVVRALAVNAKLVEYRQVVGELRQLVEDGSVPESSYQKLLQANPWLFGSEYSELLDRRRWTRDDNLDFMLRRTSDNYLEIVEIKTPLTQPLFNKDSSHDSYYPSAPLAQVIGQVIRYIEEVERQRDSIAARDNDDPLKVRARVIIGRDDGDDGQRQALRNLNAHLHRIEVLTFDQLLRIGQRVLAVFEGEAEEEQAPPEESVIDEDSIPF